jgi:hypothetical protein
MGIKTYTIAYGPTWWECQVQIDHDFLIDVAGEQWTIEKVMHEMIVFWSGGPGRIKENTGDITKTFLQQLAAEIQQIQVENNYTLEGVIEEFTNHEGWWPMDGSAGIKILDVDDFEFSFSEYEVLEDPQK